MGVFVGGGGGGGLTWTLILRIFGMVSITFFFAPPLGSNYEIHVDDTITKLSPVKKGILIMGELPMLTTII